MADITIDADVFFGSSKEISRGGIFWTSPTVGYVIYQDSAKDLKYNKTGNGGATWGGAVNIRTGNIVAIDSWADWQTVGDAGTKIHIVYMDSDSDDVRYVYLDTSTDTIGGDVQIEACQGTGVMDSSWNFAYHHASITKTRGGNLAVAFRYRDGVAGYFYEFYTSPDGTNWTNEASPWEADSADLILLFPGNEADNQDVWATFWDATANQIMLKTYDDSGDSWTEQLIAAGMAASSNYLQMDGQIRLSDGHLILAAWTIFDNAIADLHTWDINGAASITGKTEIKNNAAEYFLVSVFINQDNDDIYVTYAGGTAIDSLVKVFYQKSVNGGGAWDGEQAMQANAEDDETWISAGAMKSSWGGKFQPVWLNEDLQDIFTNTANGISIAVVAVDVTITVPLATADSVGIVPVMSTTKNPTISVPLATADGAGIVPTMSLDRMFDVPLATVDIAGIVPVIAIEPEISVPLATVSATGLVPTLSLDRIFTVPLATVSVTGLVPTITTTRSPTILVPLGTIEIEGLTPTLRLDVIFSIPLATITAEGLAPEIIAEFFRGLGVEFSYYPYTYPITYPTGRVRELADKAVRDLIEIVHRNLS